VRVRAARTLCMRDFTPNEADKHSAEHDLAACRFNTACPMAHTRTRNSSRGGVGDNGVTVSCVNVGEDD
jgi:hypothetical protein